MKPCVYLKPSNPTIWKEWKGEGYILVFNKTGNTYRNIKATIEDIDRKLGDSYIKIVQDADTDGYPGTIGSRNSVVWINPECVERVTINKLWHYIALRAGNVDDFLIKGDKWLAEAREGYYIPKYLYRLFNEIFTPVGVILKYGLLDKCDRDCKKTVKRILGLQTTFMNFCNYMERV